MKKNFTRFLALLMALAIVFSLGACGKDEGETTTVATEETTAEVTTIEGETTTLETTTVDGETTTGDTTTAVGDTTAVGETTTEAGKPTTPAQILAAYTEVMNKAKKDGPAYKKLEFQALPKSKQNMEGAVIGALLPIAESFMTKEADAKVENNVKGNDMKWFPVSKSSKGCMVTDATAFKTATCDVLANGNYKIVLVLKDEMNPEPYKEGQSKATSNHGNMFSPLAKADIDKEIDGVPGTRNVKYALKYYDCKAILEYNPVTKQIVNLEQYMYVFIDIQDGKLFILNVKGTAVLENKLKAWDFKY